MATIISETGEIDRLNHPKKLVEFAGVDPSVLSSGKFAVTFSRINKRGSSRLRHVLYEAASCGLRKTGRNKLRVVQQHGLVKLCFLTNFLTPDTVSMVSTPTKVMMPWYCLLNFCSSGASLLQGAHHDANAFKITGCPLANREFNETFLFVFSSVMEKLGVSLFLETCLLAIF
ncbi:IS110 family transposase [Alicyclobacillus sp. SO9]|nr:IS110 family transposase [Alicyclobacillus sp. SO9]